MMRVGSTVSARPKYEHKSQAHLQIMLTCRHPFHTRDLALRTPLVNRPLVSIMHSPSILEDLNHFEIGPIKSQRNFFWYLGFSYCLGVPCSLPLLSLSQKLWTNWHIKWPHMLFWAKRLRALLYKGHPIMKFALHVLCRPWVFMV